MAGTEPRQPVDLNERRKAIDISRSCIVQAPAGSGKTELLVQRILALLAVAETPEEILSLTFTRKSAGEMRVRLLQALERAKDDHPPLESHAAEIWQRARCVLERDREKNWRLLQNPSRLQLTTIDSFCAYLTRRMPWLARFGDQPKVTEDPAELYLLAAENLLSKLEKGGAGQDAIECMLSHLDNRLTQLRDLLVAMLGRRDQWLRHLMAQRDDDPRRLLETCLRLYVCSVLQKSYTALGSETYEDLVELLRFAAGNLDDDHLLTIMLREEADPASLQQWLALVDLVLTASGSVRKNVNKTIGFPADKTPLAQEMKARAQSLLEQLRETPVAASLNEIRCLPATRYDQEQWLILSSLIELLPLAVVALKEVFRLHGQVDFIEIAGAARAALGSVTSPEELLLQLDNRVRHILVDEFQDTSCAQYDLLSSLTAGWTSGDGRTLFVVGDPMQSIYRFREAEVGLYLRVCQRGLDGLPMDRIVLNTNFRSTSNLVEWVNNKFSSLFPAKEDELRGAVRFASARAHKTAIADSVVCFHAFEQRQDLVEAERVVGLVEQVRARSAKETIAILARSRSHLAEIVSAFKKSGLKYQAQDVDPLIDRPVIQDLLSLTRALRHPSDRVAWLALLRAPWCGLTLEDLARLCGNDTRSTVWQLLTQPAEQVDMFAQISPDANLRLARIIPALDRALKNRGRLSLRRLVESTWLAINGPACVEEADLVDAGQFFTLLENLDVECPMETIEVQLGKLFAAPNPQAGPELQLMTIHKAKGLEFDTVILPGLGRGVRSRERALLRWLEHTDYGLLLAPIPPVLSEAQEPTYQAIGHILQEKDDFETLRLLYVAVTRARVNLHLLGHVKRNSDGEFVPLSGSLLSALWPACNADFTQQVLAAAEKPLEQIKKSTLKRLPKQWQPVPFEKKLVVWERPVLLASDDGHYHDEMVKSRRTEEGRVVGTLVHNWLERIAADGLDQWPPETLEIQTDSLRANLSLLGIPLSRLDYCVTAVLTCLINTVRSKQGRWLLGSHREAACEFALNGVVDGQLVRAVIDRAFLDRNSTWWIVDYKTSRPKPERPVTLFMEAEAERYAGQLRHYRRLVEQLKPDIPVRSALYFPMFDGWIEVDDKS